MTNDSTMRELWRTELGDDAEPLWHAFRMAEPPPAAPLEQDHCRPGWMWLGLAASWLGIAALFAWNVSLQKDIAEARNQTALVLLAAERSDRVMAGLAKARRFDPNPVITEELLHLLKTSEDPNVQLEALELLLDDALQNPENLREVLEEIRFNRAFIEFALLTREIPT